MGFDAQRFLDRIKANYLKSDMLVTKEELWLCMLIYKYANEEKEVNRISHD